MDKITKNDYYNDYDENDREIKKKYLGQLQAITCFMEEELKREIERRKEKADEYRVRVDEYFKETNLYGYTDEISDMPRKPGKNTASATERLALDKIEMEETLKKLKEEEQALKESVDGEDPEEIDAEFFEMIELEHPNFRVVYVEVLSVIHSISSLKKQLVLKDVYLRGKTIADIQGLLLESKSKVYDLFNSALDSIRIPEAQHRREWIEW